MDMNPVWIDLVPYISFVVAVASFGIKLGKVLERQDNGIEDVKEIRIELKDINTRVIILETLISK